MTAAGWVVLAFLAWAVITTVYRWGHVDGFNDGYTAGRSDGYTAAVREWD